MEFDKSKVYTAFNADEVKVGSRGYYADSLGDLKKRVNSDDKSYYDAVIEINSIFHTYRFTINKSVNIVYAFFYLVEGPAEKKFRPYQSTNEMVDDFMKRFYLLPQIYQLPIIWIKNKDYGQKSFILDYNETIVTTSTRIMSMEYLFEHYVYLDDSPCGIAE